MAIFKLGAIRPTNVSDWLLEGPTTIVSMLLKKRWSSLIVSNLNLYTFDLPFFLNFHHRTPPSPLHFLFSQLLFLLFSDSNNSKHFLQANQSKAKQLFPGKNSLSLFPLSLLIYIIYSHVGSSCRMN